MNLNAVVYGLVLALTLIPYQNCTTEAGKTFVTAAAQENGEGYNGKITYESRAGGSVCADGLPNTTIVVEDGEKAFLTRDNCAPVTNLALPFAAVDFLPHNLRNVGYGGFAFDREGTVDGVSSLFCRGRSTSLEGENRAVDAVIKTVAGNPVSYRGHVILGIYDANWKLKETKDMGELPVRPDNSIPGHQIYNSEFGHSDIFTLDVLLANMTARLIYASTPPPLPTSVPAPLEPAPYNGEFRTVDGLNCYVQ